MEKTLITPVRVVELAFPDGAIPPSTITEDDIAAAEERWLVPVIGRELYDAMRDGDHAVLRDDYLAAPVALFTRVALQPRLDIRTDRSGTTAPKNAYGQPADTEALRDLRTQLLQEARTLLRRASDYLRTHARQFPLYDPDNDILARRTIAGGILLDGHGPGSR